MGSILPDVPAAKLVRLYGRVAYALTMRTAGPVLRGLYNIRVEGRGSVPRYGPAIITPNHLSFIDPFFVALVVPRHVTFIGKAEYWDSWTTRWFFEMAGAIPVRREDAEQAAGSLEAGKEVLRGGHVLGIFPEGTRSPDGRLYKGKTGAARMALEVGCPIVPAGLVGTGHILPKDARLPGLGPRVTVKFGAPMRVPEEAGEDPRALRGFTDSLMTEIARLTGQTYRHRYAHAKRFTRPVEPVVPFS